MDKEEGWTSYNLRFEVGEGREEIGLIIIIITLINQTLQRCRTKPSLATLTVAWYNIHCMQHLESYFLYKDCSSGTLNIVIPGWTAVLINYLHNEVKTTLVSP